MRNSIFLFLFLISFTAFSQMKQNNLFDQLFFKGMNERIKNNYEKSNDFFAQCLTIEPDNDVIFFKMAQNYYEMKAYMRSADYLREAQKINQKNKWYQKLYIELQIVQNVDSKIILKLIKDYETKIHNKYIIADLKQELFRRKQDRVKETDINKNNNYNTYLDQLWQQKAYSKLIDTAVQLLNQQPDDPNIYLWIAKAYTTLKKYPQAIEYLNMGIDFAEVNKIIHRNFLKQYIIIYNSWGNPQKTKYYSQKLNKI